MNKNLFHYVVKIYGNNKYEQMSSFAYSFLFFSSQPVKSTEIGDIGITTIPTDCVVETPQSFTFTPSVALTKSFQFSFFSTEVPPTELLYDCSFGNTTTETCTLRGTDPHKKLTVVLKSVTSIDELDSLSYEQISFTIHPVLSKDPHLLAQQ